MNLLFVADSGYIPTLIPCIRSLARFTPIEGYDIYLLHSDLSHKDQQKLVQPFAGQEIRFHFCSIDGSIFEGLPETDRYPKQIYYRILAARFLPDTLDRILYLDGDIVVINSLEELYHTDFEDNYYVACTHVNDLLNKINMIRLAIEDEVPYINTGVLLINLEKLRKEQDPQAVFDYAQKHKFAFILPDQDIITALYGKKIKLIPYEKYNLSDRMLTWHNADLRNDKIDLTWIRKNTVIIHYCGRQKPWKENYRGILDVFYEEIPQA